jgi:hypothetical protein
MRLLPTFLHLQARLIQFFSFFLANRTSFKNEFLLIAFFIDVLKRHVKIKFF